MKTSPKSTFSSVAASPADELMAILCGVVEAGVAGSVMRQVWSVPEVAVMAAAPSSEAETLTPVLLVKPQSTACCGAC